MAQTDSKLGPILRLRPLDVRELPHHPDLESEEGAAPDLQVFLSSALQEAHGFVTQYIPDQFHVKSSSEKSSPSTAPIKLLVKDVRADELPKATRDVGAREESWFARESTHENAAKTGTASWEEMDGVLRVDHARHEKDYTPDVLDAHEVVSWSKQLEGLGGRVGGWEEVNASVMEMVHHIPGPLNNRVFCVLVVTAKREREFLDLQLPVSTKELPGSKYYNDNKVTHGMYVSVEHGELLDDGAKVRWRMATASNAKGALPMWAQKMGIPGAVVKDVGLVMDYLAKQRKSGT